MLVERSVEVSSLQHSLAECLAGAGGVTVISGPVGAGKTELLNSIGREAVEAGALFVCTDAFRDDQTLVPRVLRQVLAVSDLSADKAKSASRLLEEAELAMALHDPDDRDPERAMAPVLHGLMAFLLELSESRPLVIGIDDAHWMDIASLQFFLFLSRRIGQARLLFVIGENTSVRPVRPLLWAELLSQPRSRNVRPGLLSVPGVAALLAQYPDLPGSYHPALVHQITGGNPRLVTALIRDCLAGRAATAAPVVGDTFGHGVLTCLFRSDAALLPVVRALALLDEPSRPALLSELLGTDVDSVTWLINAAADAGLLEGDRFRHERAQMALLDVIGSQERAELHKRIADVLYRRGASAAAVARHKIAARHTEAPWSTPVLREAAEQALDEDDAGFALDCLCLAESGAAEEGERANVRSAIVQAEWRLDPASAERNVRQLLDASRAGDLGSEYALALVNRLSWYGQPAEAAEVLARVGESVTEADGETLTAWHSTRLWLAYTYPGLLERAADGASRSRLPRITSTAGKLRARSVCLIDTLLTEGFTKDALDEAQAIIQQSRLNDHTYEPILASLEMMTAADRFHEAAFWCDSLLGQAEERRVPTWCAHLSAIRALISFRQGDLTEARRYASAAMSHISPRGFGVFIGVPLSVLVLIAIRAGQYDTALSYLSVPVPHAMFHTLAGLYYLGARGRYYLAHRSYKAAIEDFETCGDLMAKWGLDLPGIIPWRTDLAEANLAMGVPAKNLVLGVLKLSDAERRVASLAAQGCTNRQIAGQLYITVSTVEQHLTRAYRKLQITRRADLPSVLMTIPRSAGPPPSLQRPVVARMPTDRCVTSTGIGPSPGRSARQQAFP